MSKKMAAFLTAYGGVLVGLGLLWHRLTVSGNRVAFITGAVAGGLSAIWGLAAMAGLKGRAWAVLTVIPAAFALLFQAGQAWTTPAGDNGWLLRGTVTVMFVMTLAILMYLLHGERTPEFYQTRTTPQRGDAPAPPARPSAARDYRTPR
jgi:hypothetical protein